MNKEKYHDTGGNRMRPDPPKYLPPDSLCSFMTFASTVFYNTFDKRILLHIAISATVTSTFPYFSAGMVFPIPFCGQVPEAHSWNYFHIIPPFAFIIALEDKRISGKLWKRYTEGV